MEKVSVILPMYNVEKYLPQCIQALDNQTYHHVEYLFIDDGSSDNGASIIIQKANTDSRFVYFKKENGGAASARNFGIEKATGQYIMFYDPDDYLYPDAIESMLYPMINNPQVNVVVSKYNRVYEGKKPLGAYFYKFQRTIDTSQLGDTVFENKSLFYNMYQAPWGKMFRSTIFVDRWVRFPEIAFYEDLLFTIKHFPDFGKILFIDKITIDYLVRPGSSMTTNNNEQLIKMLGIKSDVDDDLESNSLLKIMELETIRSYQQRNIYEEFKAELEFIYIQHIIFGLSYRLKISTLKNKKEGYKQLLNAVKLHFPNAEKNKYLQKESFLLRGYCSVFMKNAKIMNLIFGKK